MDTTAYASNFIHKYTTTSKLHAKLHTLIPMITGVCRAIVQLCSLLWHDTAAGDRGFYFIYSFILSKLHNYIIKKINRYKVLKIKGFPEKERMNFAM